MKQSQNVPSSAGEVSMDYEFVDFEVIREGWNRYRLEDGSILKVKFILINAITEKNFAKIIKKTKPGKAQKVDFAIQPETVFGIEAPMNLRGEPDTKKYTETELLSSIVKKDIDFEAITETWNIYKLKNGLTLKVRNSPINVSRTSKFDERGLPLYVIESAADIKITLSQSKNE
jgi:hypothetical protein